MISGNNRIQPVLISGQKNAGKTSYMQFLLTQFRKKNRKVAGFISLGEMENGKKSNYYLLNVKTDEKRLLACREGRKNFSIRIGQYYFDPDAFQNAEKVLKNSLDAEAIFIDEYGPLESRGEGLRPALDFLLRHYHGIIFLSVRPTLIKNLQEVLAP